MAGVYAGIMRVLTDDLDRKAMVLIAFVLVVVTFSSAFVANNSQYNLYVHKGFGGVNASDASFRVLGLEGISGSAVGDASYWLYSGQVRGNTSFLSAAIANATGGGQKVTARDYVNFYEQYYGTKPVVAAKVSTDYYFIVLTFLFITAVGAWFFIGRRRYGQRGS